MCLIVRSDEIEMISKQRKPSGVGTLRQQLSRESPAGGAEASPDDAGYSSSEYSPMTGVSRDLDQDDTDAPLLSVSQQDYHDHHAGEESYSGASFLQTSSYVPPGYIVLEPGRNRNHLNSDEYVYEGFQPFSVSSV